MTCMDTMYQPGLSSCFPAFNSPAYANMNPYQTTSTACTPSSADLPKKHAASSSSKYYGMPGSSRMSDLSTAFSVHDLAAQHSRNTGLVPSTSYSAPKTAGVPEAEKPVSTQYVSPTSTVLIYYNGNATSAVDNHFNRSLTPTNQYGKGATPLASRPLPASFWNPNPIQPTQSYPSVPYHSYPSGYPSTSSDYAASYGDAYYPSSFHHSATFQHPQSDPWNYAAAAHYNSAAAANFSRAAASLQAGTFPAADRFGSSYNSILFPSVPSMRGSRMDVSGGCKTAGPWTAHTVFGSDVAHYPSMSSDYDHTLPPVNWNCFRGVTKINNQKYVQCTFVITTIMLAAYFLHKKN